MKRQINLKPYNKMVLFLIFQIKKKSKKLNKKT